MKAVPPKTHIELVGDWNRLAVERNRQIVSGEDISFHHVVVPTALSLIGGCNTSTIVEIGSGTGHFTKRLAALGEHILAVEPSEVSLGLAKDNCSANKNVSYIGCPIECAVEELKNMDVTSAIAVMTLMTAPNLLAVARSLSAILPHDARFVAVMTHPWFWPQYWGYHDKQWFNYEKEIFVEAPFTISRRATDVLTTHIHRPLWQYLAAFSDNGFHLEHLVEPLPSFEAQKLYPEPWRFPRFIGLRWIRRRCTPKSDEI